MRSVGVDLDDAAAPDDVHVGEDLVVAGDWMDAQSRKGFRTYFPLGGVEDEPFKMRLS